MRKVNHNLRGIKMIAGAVACLMLAGCMPFGSMDPGAATPQQEDPESIRLYQFEEPAEGQETAVIETSHGTIVAVLYPDQAPNTVKHFEKLVKEGFYTNRPVFHQAKDIKAIISGSSDEDGREGKIATDDGKPLEPEVTTELWHFSGALSVLGQEKGFFSKRYVGDSRFFILGDIPATADLADQMKQNEYPDRIIEAYKKRGGLPQLTGNYTVFGQVISGMDVVEKILAVSSDDKTQKLEDGTVIKSIALSSYHHGDPVDFTFEKYVPPPISSSQGEASGESSSQAQ